MPAQIPHTPTPLANSMATDQFSPISPLSNYLLRMGTNSEPVRDGRALERVLQQASTLSSPEASYVRAHPILFSPSSTLGSSAQVSSPVAPAFTSSFTSPLQSPQGPSMIQPGPAANGTFFSPSLPQPPLLSTPLGGRTTPPSPALHYHVASAGAVDAARDLGAGPDVSDEAIERMRRWLSTMIFEPLAAVINEVDTSLEAEGLAHLTTRSAYLAYPALDLLGIVDLNKGGLKMLAPNAAPPPAPSLATSLFQPKPSAFGGFFQSTASQQPAQKPGSLGALYTARPNDPIVRKRLLLELYLTLPATETFSRFSRDYIVARIRDLAVGSMLSAFRWDGGGAFGGEEWTRQRPTDAELVLHCLLTFLDIQIQMAGIAVTSLTPFTSKFFVPPDGKPDPTRSVQIRQSSRAPPQFNLVLHGTRVVEGPAKRQNLFSTLALFVRHVAQESAGWLGLLYLGAPEINLLQVYSGSAA
ncbi:cytochrome B561, N terminal-domain-containing protein [Hyaloraphidium curvatum]|nr:cytochrome B561, N terminal-domain-containing protein [Hyaloraphidium curvatum]